VRGATGMAPLSGRVRESSERPWSGMLILIIRVRRIGLKLASGFGAVTSGLLPHHRNSSYNR
jgi:hypothetical protein